MLFWPGQLNIVRWGRFIGEIHLARKAVLTVTANADKVCLQSNPFSFPDHDSNQGTILIRHLDPNTFAPTFIWKSFNQCRWINPANNNSCPESVAVSNRRDDGQCQNRQLPWCLESHQHATDLWAIASNAIQMYWNAIPSSTGRARWHRVKQLVKSWSNMQIGSDWNKFSKNMQKHRANCTTCLF